MHIARGHFGNLPGVRDVDLVQGDEPRPVLKSSVRLEPASMTSRSASGPADRWRSRSHDDGGTSFDAQEIEPETPSFAGSLDQPRYVRDREADVTGNNHPRLGTRVVKG